MFYLMPVSYTHLDVYKRQVYIYIAHNVYDNEAGTVIIIGTRR